MEEGDILIAKDVTGVSLTYNKEYTCLAVSGCKVVVKDNSRRKNLYYSVRFIKK